MGQRHRLGFAHSQDDLGDADKELKDPSERWIPCRLFRRHENAFSDLHKKGRHHQKN